MGAVRQFKHYVRSDVIVYDILTKICHDEVDFVDHARIRMRVQNEA